MGPQPALLQFLTITATVPFCPAMAESSAAAVNAPLAAGDPAIAALIAKELQRQESHLELIASENFASRAVMEAQGSVLTNKYAEGLPSKRYYGGCEHVDAIEELAIERAKQLFGAAWANVQPHSGARPILPCSWRCCSPATRSWAWTSATAVTSPTVRR